MGLRVYGSIRFSEVTIHYSSLSGAEIIKMWDINGIKEKTILRVQREEIPRSGREGKKA